jgi:transposase
VLKKTPRVELRVLICLHEARTPRFGRRISEFQEYFVHGNTQSQNPMFFVADTEERLAKAHPLRAVKRRADEVLKQMSRSFDAAYSEEGRPSIPPEQLLKALLQALYSILLERRLVDAINWNLLYRWFCGLDPDAAVWDATTFTKNRERFERHGSVQKFMRLRSRPHKTNYMVGKDMWRTRQQCRYCAFFQISSTT